MLKLFCVHAVRTLYEFRFCARFGPEVEITSKIVSLKWEQRYCPVNRGLKGKNAEKCEIMDLHLYQRFLINPIISA